MKQSGPSIGVAEQAPPLVSSDRSAILKLKNKSNNKRMAGNNHNGNGGGNVGFGTIGTKPTLLELPKMKFLIMDAPRQQNLHLYIKEMSNYGVTDLVRVCEPTYQGAELKQAGIVLHDMEYPDGHSPPQPVIDQWLQLVETSFFSESSSNPPDKCISVHCVAGLGRAPVMVAIAMIEFGNYDPVEAVSMIRRHRRGAINEKQLLYLEKYKPTLRRGKEAGCGCVIS
jgi:protein tyrosine phosphatase type IVA